MIKRISGSRKNAYYIIGQYIRSIILAFGILFAIAAAGCKGNKGGESKEELPIVAVSIDPIGYFAKVIGGDSLDVVTLIPGGSDPETLQPGVGTMRQMQSAPLLFTTGLLPFERALSEKISANNAAIKNIDLSEGIELIYGTHAHGASDGDHDGRREDADPHIWSSVKNARVIARNMRDAIIENYPEHGVYYEQRYQALDSMLRMMDERLSHELAGRNVAFLIWHPSLSYFARDYELTQIAVNRENKETSPKELSEILSRSREEGPKAFFVPEGTNSGSTAAIARETGLEITPVNFMSGDWQGHIELIESRLK